jgi:hypothetical protein
MKALDKTKNYFGNRPLNEIDSDDSDDNEDQRSTRTVRQIERERSLSPSSNELINITRAADNAASRQATQNIAPAQPQTQTQTVQPNISISSNSSNLSNVSRNTVDSPSTSYQRPMTPAMTRVFNESYDRSGAGTPFVPGMAGRIPCQALTQRGLPCKNAAAVGFNFCRVHNK